MKTAEDNDFGEIYKSLDKLGVELTDEQKAKLAEQEKNYIQSNLLPHIVDILKPTLKTLWGDRTILVLFDSKDKEGYVTAFKDKMNDEDSVLYNFTLKENEHIPKKRKPNQKMVVRINGKIVSGSSQSDIFCEAIRIVGIRSVKALGMTANGIDLISTQLNPRKRQKQVGQYYIETCLSLQQKKERLEYIARKLGINLTVEVE